jgi:lipopolysaccharide heptosyltransferase II
VRILIVKPSSLGDVVQALPVLRRLKQQLPASAIHWWIDEPWLPLLQGDPDLAGLVPFRRRRWASPRRWPEALVSIGQLRALRFDWVIDLQGLARSGLFAWLAGGALLVGVDDPREGARGFYDLVVPRPSRQTHAVDWYLGVLPLLGLSAQGDFTWLPARPEIAQGVRDRWPVAGSRWVAVLPGARWPNKRWPVAHYAELVRRLAADHTDLRFAVLGGAEDRPLGDVIARANGPRCLDLTGQTTLPEMVEWLRLSAVVVTNDTGPMHVAAALGRPVVALFGPTEPRRTGPYGQVDRVLQLPSLACVPCLKARCAHPSPLECLQGLRPEVACAAVKRHLGFGLCGTASLA